MVSAPAGAAPGVLGCRWPRGFDLPAIDAGPAVERETAYFPAHEKPILRRHRTASGLSGAWICVPRAAHPTERRRRFGPAPAGRRS
jgi:hypothetical protein